MKSYSDEMLDKHGNDPHIVLAEERNEVEDPK